MFDLNFLADQARSGDPTAAADLRSELECQMVRIVRRAVGARSGTTPLARRILAEYDEVSRQDGAGSFEDREWLIDRVARRMSASMLHGLNPDRVDVRGTFDTVRN